MEHDIVDRVDASTNTEKHAKRKKSPECQSPPDGFGSSDLL